MEATGYSQWFERTLAEYGQEIWIGAGWEGSFYPTGLAAHDQLAYYAQHFDTLA
jgi:uncharacterized protein YecE (DUF72 family)